MMRMTQLRFVVASCVLGLLPLSAQAQERQQERQAGQASQQRDQDSQQRGQAQQGGQAQQRGQAGQRDQDSQQRGQQAGQTQQRGQQGRIQQGQQGQKGLEDFLVQRLILANQAEIELSQMATEQAQNDEVKQFAQKMIQDHQQMLQKLQQHSGHQTGGQSQTEQGQQAQQSQQAQPGQQAQQGQQVPQQLTQITQQAAQRHLQMSKEMLQEAQGEDFDKAFMGIQVVKHSMMVAELEAMRNAGSQEFQKLVSTAAQKTQEHLDHAKQVVMQLNNGGGDGQRATQGRRATSPGQPGAQPTRRATQGGAQGGAQGGVQGGAQGDIQGGVRGSN